MLMYRPFDFWAANADWSAQLPADERPLCLAAGRGFVAAATSAHQLRLYSAAGRQLAVLALPGAPVALAAAGPLLLAAHHAADPAWAADAAGGQRLAFALYDAARQALLASGPLPLGRGAGLAWLGLSDEGLPAAYDTAGVMRLRSADWGGAWVPVFDAKAARSEGASAEAFWPVGVSTRELTCVVTSEAKPHPAVHPRPVLAVRPLRAGGAPADGAPADLEDDALRHALRLGALRAAAADADGEETGKKRRRGGSRGLCVCFCCMQSYRPLALPSSHAHTRTHDPPRCPQPYPPPPLSDADEAQRRADDVEAALLEADRGALRQFNVRLALLVQKTALPACCLPTLSLWMLGTHKRTDSKQRTHTHNHTHPTYHRPRSARAARAARSSSSARCTARARCRARCSWPTRGVTRRSRSASAFSSRSGSRGRRRARRSRRRRRRRRASR